MRENLPKILIAGCFLAVFDCTNIPTKGEKKTFVLAHLQYVNRSCLHTCRTGKYLAKKSQEWEFLSALLEPACLSIKLSGSLAYEGPYISLKHKKGSVMVFFFNLTLWSMSG